MFVQKQQIKMQLTIDFPDNLFLYFNLLRILSYSAIKIGKVVICYKVQCN